MLLKNSIAIVVIVLLTAMLIYSYHGSPHRMPHLLGGSGDVAIPCSFPCKDTSNCRGGICKKSFRGDNRCTFPIETPCGIYCDKMRGNDTFGLEEMNAMAEPLFLDKILDKSKADEARTNEDEFIDNITVLFSGIVLPGLSKNVIKWDQKTICSDSTLNLIDLCNKKFGGVGNTIEIRTIEGLLCKLKLYSPSQCKLARLRAFPKIGNKQAFFAYIPGTTSFNINARIKTTPCGTQTTTIQIRIAFLMLMFGTVESNKLQELRALQIFLTKFDYHITDNCTNDVANVFKTIGNFFTGGLIDDIIHKSLFSAFVGMSKSLGKLFAVKFPLPIRDFLPYPYGDVDSEHVFYTFPFVGAGPTSGLPLPRSGIVSKHCNGYDCNFKDFKCISDFIICFSNEWNSMGFGTLFHEIKDYRLFSPKNIENALASHMLDLNTKEFPYFFSSMIQTYPGSNSANFGVLPCLGQGEGFSIPDQWIQACWLNPKSCLLVSRQDLQKIVPFYE